MTTESDQGKPIWLNITNPELLAAIGRVVTHWAFLEALIEETSVTSDSKNPAIKHAHGQHKHQYEVASSNRAGANAIG